MLFNSYEFIFLFFPATVAVFFLLRRMSRNLALSWIIVASLIFYAWWRPANLLIICTSLGVNFVFAELLRRYPSEQYSSRIRNLILALGVCFNLLFLGYFKYVNFVRSVIHDVTGTDFVLVHVILPLGISFFTFQQIAFLIDVHGERIKEYTFREFALFVLFFPQLIAGPIVHFREMIPQFRSNACRFDREGISVGLTIFSFGLFKKVILADGIAPYVTPVYDAAAAGDAVSLFTAWIAALGFTLQIYFDFSGYSDMAAGLARCFGVKLPLNFNSPLKASNIIDFWSRWHITLTRFLTAYVYNPLALWRTRTRIARGQRGIAGPNTSAGAFMQILAFPTLATMFLSGLWHGAGYLFILWGTLHGVYLVINHIWRLLKARIGTSQEGQGRLPRLAGFLITFLSVTFAMVLFRAPTSEAAVSILRGMVGLNGISLPQQIMDRLGLTDLIAPIVSPTNMLSAGEFLLGYAWVLALLLIALMLPNSVQVMARYEPVLGSKPQPANQFGFFRGLNWAPTIPWAIAISLLAATSILRLGGPSEFLYWQF
jgi:D-alanyl-lipoteichoic acid acyltransferase DltB (MBOAT superfamily)